MNRNVLFALLDATLFGGQGTDRCHTLGRRLPFKAHAGVLRIRLFGNGQQRLRKSARWCLLDGSRQAPHAGEGREQEAPGAREWFHANV